MRSLKLLLIGTGRMAHTHAQRFQSMPGVSVVAAVDVCRERVQQFCATHDIAHAYTDLAAALAAHTLDAACVVTPDSAHAPSSIRCLQEGLAVLCEKPLSDTLESSQAMVAEAEIAGVLNMVNFTYRISGALHQAREWIDQGRLGTLRHFEASYRQSWLCSPYWGEWTTEDAWLWRLSTAHGSTGVLGDIGIHILDFLIAGAGQGITGLHCRLQTFDKAPGNRIGEYDLDANDSCIINAQLENGALGVVHMSRYQTGYMNDLCLSLYGTRGALRVSTGQKGDRLSACLGEDIHTQTWREISCSAQPDTFERFISGLRGNGCGSPDFAHAGDLQLYLSRCSESHELGRWLDCSSAAREF